MTIKINDPTFKDSTKNLCAKEIPNNEIKEQR
jgi:hypothetical protein